MKKYLFSVILVLLMGCQVLLQQTSVDPILRNSVEKNRPDEYRSIVESFESEYETTSVNGVPIKSNSMDGIIVSLSMEEDRSSALGKYFAINIGIQNNSGQRFNFSEENIDGYFLNKDRYGQLFKYDHKMVGKKLKGTKFTSPFP